MQARIAKKARIWEESRPRLSLASMVAKGYPQDGKLSMGYPKTPRERSLISAVGSTQADLA